MNLFRLFVFLFVIPLFAFTSIHKYYVSVTQINYVQEKQSLQIITRIFVDDFENLLQEQYDANIILTGNDEPKIVNTYIEDYLKEKIVIKINNQNANVKFIGKEYDGDIMRCYLEVEGVKNINSFEISNQVLFDLFEDQQNIIKTNINSKQKSMILNSKSKNMVLKFN